MLDEAKSKGIDIQPKYIPAEVFDRRSVEKNQVVFHDVAAIEVNPIVRRGTGFQPVKHGQDAHATYTVAVQLTVKVVDIFGNDTMTIVDVAVGGKK